MIRLAAVFATAAVLGVVLIVVAQPDGPGNVEIIKLTAENFAKFAPAGKEVDAIAGDVVLRNKYITAVIAQPLESRHANMTVRQVGGSLIDFTTRENPSDQLSAYYPGQRTYAYRAWKGIDDDGVEIDLSKPTEVTTETGRVVVSAEGTETLPAVETSYILEPDEVFIVVTTQYTNTTKKPMKVSLVDDLRIDAGKEYLGKSENGVGTLFWAYDRHWKQAYGVFGLDLLLEMNSDPRLSTLKYRVSDDNDVVTLEPGQSHQVSRWLFAGENLLDIKAAAADLRGLTLESARLVFTGQGRPISQADVAVSKSGKPYGGGRTNDKGELDTLLPVGAYEFEVSVLGIKLKTAKPLRVELLEGTGGEIRFDVPDYQPGTVAAEIVDDAGRPLPCKVSFTAQASAAQIDFGPETGDYAVKNLRYTANGTLEQLLPPGMYDVVVSRGPEYDAVFTSVTVLPGKSVPLKAVLKRSVSTPGWVSGDFHSHSSPSGDNTSSQLGRVLNLLAENIEFAPCTEHNRIDTYEPWLDLLKARPFMGTTSGMELTGLPLPLNHQNAFPLERKPYIQDGGAPLTDGDPAAQIERLAAWDNRREKLVQVNHPDIGWMFYDRDGDGQPDTGLDRMFAHINVMEIHPVEGVLRLEPTMSIKGRVIPNRVFGWMQLLNQGHRIPGVVNTDAHYNFHGSGWLRNWIHSPTDDPAQIKPLDVVQAAREGRVVMSNGPYLEVSAVESGKTDKSLPGQSLAITSGKLQLSIRVQCPNWLDVDRVFVLVNGRPHPQHNYTRVAHAAKFRSAADGSIRFDEMLTLELTADAHVIVATGGDSKTLGPVMGPDWKDTSTAAFSNPIYVDVDGNGFQANKDTLGHPLPVKFISK